MLHFRPDRLEKERLKKGWTQEDVAKKIGVARPTYSNYENGNREPDFKVITALSDLYDVSTDYLIGNTDNPERYTELKQAWEERNKPTSDSDNWVLGMENHISEKKAGYGRELTKEEKVRAIVEKAGEPGSAERLKLKELFEEFSKLPDSAQKTVMDLIKQMPKKE